MLEHRLEFGEAMRRARFRVVFVGKRARQRVRIRGHVHLREERAVTAAVLGLRRREARGTDRAPVESPAESDDRLAARGLARQLDRPFDRLRAAVAEEDRIQAPGCDRGQLLRERDARFIFRHTRGDVHEPLGLIDDGFHDARMRMSDSGDGDAACQVEHTSTVGRHKPAPLPALDR